MMKMTMMPTTECNATWTIIPVVRRLKWVNGKHFNYDTNSRQLPVLYLEDTFSSDDSHLLFNTRRANAGQRMVAFLVVNTE